MHLAQDLCSRKVRNKQVSTLDAALDEAQNELNFEAEDGDSGSERYDVEM